MLDIDILVEPAHFAAMTPLLADLGYQAAPERHPAWNRFRSRFEYALRSLTRSDLPTSIEVHRHPGWRPDLVPTELMFTERQTIAAGLALARPWCAAFHAVTHWQNQDGGLRQLSSPTRAVLEVARHFARDDVDFDQLIRHAERVGMRREIEVAAAFANDLFGVRVPSALAPGATARRHVARCLAIRGSPARSWIARERGRVLAMWDCKREIYRLYLQNAGPTRKAGVLWPRRLVRLPLMLVFGFYVGIAGIAKLAMETMPVRWQTPPQ